MKSNFHLKIGLTPVLKAGSSGIRLVTNEISKLSKFLLTSEAFRIYKILARSRLYHLFDLCTKTRRTVLSK